MSRGSDGSNNLTISNKGITALWDKTAFLIPSLFLTGNVFCPSVLLYPRFMVFGSHAGSGIRGKINIILPKVCGTYCRTIVNLNISESKRVRAGFINVAGGEYCGVKK